MQYCAFNARNLGLVAGTLTDWFGGGRGSHPYVIYDGQPKDALGQLLQTMLKRGWLRSVETSDAFLRHHRRLVHHAVIVGRLTPRNEPEVDRRAKRAIYINDSGYAKKGQVRDGWFPDVAFLDPRLAMPILFAALKERLEDEPTTISQLMKDELSFYGGAATELVRVAQTFLAMIQDPDCTKFLTLSGAMTIAKMGLVICDLIDEGMVDFVSSTGALVAHGTIEGIGLQHYQYDPKHSDQQLRKWRLNRVTDTLEPEENFTELMGLVRDTLDSMSTARAISGSQLLFNIGRRLDHLHPDQRGILLSAFRRNVPVVIPAFTDSEMGNDVLAYNLARKLSGQKPFTMNMELDSRALVQAAQRSERIGIFTIGGGVPRNNTQNLAPLIEIVNERLGRKYWSERQFVYGSRICPDYAFYGHLSGCTYEENASWGKMNLDRGRFAEAHTDATIGLPLVVRFAMEQLGIAA
ncbi:MAG TPA: deoxyhypusine synthase family protein [Verrucomicrobiae bacterium]|nr:deoxyhypusine synthase family protein [Verrucomicrobiae bacterium]